MKRLITATCFVVALAFGTGNALAAEGPAVEEAPVSFEVSSETCSKLPPGTTITGSGTERSITFVRTNRHGATTITNTTHSHGTATDQAGNTYEWSYSNAFRVSNSGPDDPVFTGLMVDHFSLTGNGPARLNNGFLAVFTTDFVSLFTFKELFSFGDPLDFATGEARCDPL